MSQTCIKVDKAVALDSKQLSVVEEKDINQYSIFNLVKIAVKGEETVGTQKMSNQAHLTTAGKAPSRRKEPVLSHK